jgi:hypothetical protein
MIYDDDDQFDLDAEAGPEWQPNEQIADALVEAGLEAEGDIYGVEASPNKYQQHGANARDLQLGRIAGTDYGIQATIKGYLDGSWSPTASSDPSENKLRAAERQQAIAGFEELTGTSASDFARQIKLPHGYEGGASNDPMKQRTATSMIGKTAGAYMDRGAGGQLVGNGKSPDVQATYDESTKDAFATMNRLSDMYVPAGALAGTSQQTTMALDGSTIPLHDAARGRRGAANRALTEHFINTPVFPYAPKDPVTGILGPKKIPDSIFPLPNELGVAGMKPTMATSGYMGSGYNTFEHSAWGQGQGIVESVQDPETGRWKDVIIDPTREAEWFRNMPSRKRSIMGGLPKGGTPEQRASRKAAQDKEWDKLKWDAYLAREQLLKETVTTQDENWGNTSRHTSLSNPNKDDQGEFMNTMNELAKLDLDTVTGVDLDNSRGSRVRLTNEGKEVIENIKLGSDQGGMYGAKILSESQVALRATMEGEDLDEAIFNKPPEDTRIANPTALDIQREVTARAPKQGTEEWLAQRKGNITASIAGHLLDDRGGTDSVDSVALGLTGYGKKLEINHYMAEGNRREEKVLKSFLASPNGSGLTHVDAPFTVNAAHKGFGVSPDGFLFDDKGSEAGLLELKYLSTARMKGAVERYTPQMQLQMAIAGQDKTYFHVLDSQGDSKPISEVIYADPAMQAELLSKGEEAQARAANMSVDEIRALKTSVENNVKIPNRNTRTEGTNTNAKFEETTKSGRVTNNPYRPKGTGTKGTETVEEQIRSAELREMERELDVMNQEIADYDNAMAEEADEAARALKSFGDGVKKATGVLTELANLVVQGAETGMDTATVAANLEINAQQTAGLENTLGPILTPKGASSVIASAGRLRATLDNPAEAAKEYVKIQKSIGPATSAIPDLPMMELDQRAFASMNELQLIDYTRSKIEGTSPAAQIRFAGSMGFPELANVAIPSLIGTTDEDFNEDGSRSAYKGVESVKNTIKRTLEEVVAFGGEELGTTAAAIGVGGAILGSNTVAAGSGFLASKLTTNPTSRAALLNTAGKTAANISKIAKVGSVATLAPMAVRYATGVDDDNGLADSMLDISEMTGYGAAIGSLVPIPAVGTAVGAGLGFTAGVGTELYQWATSDNSISESAKIKDGTQGQGSSAKIKDGTRETKVHEEPTETDGLGDSLIDVAGWTIAGAAAGSMIPIVGTVIGAGVGTAIGAGVGTAIGAGAELYDWATSDDEPNVVGQLPSAAIPSDSIGQVQGVASSSTSSNVNNNNVNVEVNIDPSLVTTNTDVNGYIDTDEMNTLHAGG